MPGLFKMQCLQSLKLPQFRQIFLKKLLTAGGRHWVLGIVMKVNPWPNYPRSQRFSKRRATKCNSKWSGEEKENRQEVTSFSLVLPLRGERKPLGPGYDQTNSQVLARTYFDLRWLWSSSNSHASRIDAILCVCVCVCLFVLFCDLRELARATM